MTEVWLAFIAGLAGSIHCLGMCGGIVAAISMTTRSGSPRSRRMSQAFYNLGRITTYTLLGAVAGLIGSSLNLPDVKSVGIWFSCAANSFVIVIGFASAVGLTRFNLTSLESGAGKLLAGPLRKALAHDSSPAFFPMGLLLGFLPCGLVYGPLAVAAVSGGPLKGGAIMAALGVGTMPLLMMFGSVATALSSSVRDLMFRVLGVIIMLMGLTGLWRVLARMGYLAGFPLR